MHDPVYFAFGLHAHQPVGNFHHVLEDHLRDVYEPFLAAASEGGLFPLTLHLSGPLLDWLEGHAGSYLDLVGRLVADGKLELLLAGYFEPILPSLLREDRIEQVSWMRDAIRSRFGVEARGLWLTERVWEPDLAGDLVEAGVEYLLVDDRHFVASGFARADLHQPFRTESEGKSLGVFAIDETLRYSLPFRPPEDTVDYLRKLRASGQRLAVAADDIEKFGGWPGTREWVYERGWLERFIRAIKQLESEGGIKVVTFAEALDELPSGGPAYLPSSSYREMEEWALPPRAFHRLEEVRALMGEERFAHGESPLVRGSHWRNFLVKYPESNRMHKKVLMLSRLCRERGNPPAARRALGAAQCNDAYWHGVFGGLYLRHLRDAIWKKIAEAEGEIRKGEGLSCDQVDLDLDGHQELWVHSESFSALVSPARGGVIEELTLFRSGVNLANTLTRRREAYHEHTQAPEDARGEAGTAAAGTGTESAPSIHDLEGALTFNRLPPVDTEERALFVDRILPKALAKDPVPEGGLQPTLSWSSRPLSVLSVEDGPPGPASRGENPMGSGGSRPGWIEVCLGDEEFQSYEKRIRFASNGSVEVHYRWDPADFPEDTVFATELSLGADAEVLAFPDSEVWTLPITTFSKSERGFDETVQGDSVTVRWPIETGWGRIRLNRP